MNAKKVLFIGWDAADWKVINPLMNNGLMPALQRLVSAGVSGDIRTLEPPLSPMLWTSIATGKTADKHNILGFLENNETTGKVEPVSSLDRKSRAIWNILNAQGYRCNVFNWWPSHPAEPLNGLMVSNFFNHVTAPYGEEWKVNKLGVHPEKYLEELADLRVHGEEVSPEVLESFVPSLFEILDELDERDMGLINRIRKYLAECVSVHAQATWAMENTSWDFTAVYYETIDKFSHSFMHFAPPKMSKIPTKQFERFQYVINAIYVFHDMMLDRLLDLVEDDTTVILLSDHGFHTGNLRPKALPKHHASISKQHNPLGMFVIKGEGIRSDERLFGMGLLDVAPTLLTHLGLPVGKDMDGNVIQQCFDTPQDVNYIDSWENEEGDFGEHQQRPAGQTEVNDEVLQQLVELGYVELDSDDEVQWNKTQLDRMYHLSVVHASNGRLEEALDLLEKLYEQDKVDVRINLDLIDLYARLDEPRKAREVLQLFRKLNTEQLVNFDMIEVKILQAESENKKAVQLLEKLYEKGQNRLNVSLELANAYRKRKNFPEAQKKYEEVLELDPQNHHAFHGLGICQLQTGQFEAAAQSCLAAIGLHFHAPACHYHLGESLVGMKLYEDAVNALETSLVLNPNTHRARKMLIELYEDQLPNPSKAKEHQDYIRNQASNEIIVVSGLPRSGTSLMMQMLEAGGVTILTDGQREQDESNPRGYYEFEAVKSIRKTTAWLKEATGKAVKIVAPLLNSLKLKYNYKVILMDRDIHEVLLSQQKMKQRLDPEKKKQAPYFNMKLADAYQEELAKVNSWAEEHTNVELLRMNYNELIENGADAAKKVAEFLEQELDTEAMEKVIDPNLYRERVSAQTSK